MKILWNIAKNELKIALHNKLIFLFVLFSLMIVPLMNMFNFFSAEQEMKIVKDFTFSLVSLMGIIMAIFYPIYSVKEDLERKYIYNILSKPVSHFSYIAGKFLGTCASITLICLLNFTVLFLILKIKKHGVSPSFIAAVFLLMMKFYVIAAAGILFSMLPLSFHVGSILSAFLFIAGTIKAYVMTALRYSDSSFVLSVLTPLMKTFPDFQYFDVYETLISGVAFTAQDFFRITAYGACYIGVFLCGAWLLFIKKEI